MTEPIWPPEENDKETEVLDMENYVDPHLKDLRDRTTPEIEDALENSKNKQYEKDAAKIESYTDPYLQRKREGEEIEKNDLVKKTTNQIHQSIAKTTAKDSTIPTNLADHVTAWKKSTPTQEVSKEKNWLQKGLDWFKSKGKKAAVTGAFIATGASAMATEVGKNPEKDSVAHAQMEQTIKAIENNKEVNNEIRTDWNDYLEWLKPQGLQGNESLDHNGLGMQMLKKYVETHPGTSLQATEEGVKQIQAEFIKYRKWVLDEVKAGRAQLSAGATEKNFMSWLSKYDGIPGKFTTQSRFPEAKEVTTQRTVYNDGSGRIDQKTTIVNKGFAKVGKDFTNRDDTAGLPGTELAKNK